MCFELASSLNTETAKAIHRSSIPLPSFCPKILQQISEPLDRMLGKGRQWHWTEQCSKLFDTIKTKLTSAIDKRVGDWQQSHDPFRTCGISEVVVFAYQKVLQGVDFLESISEISIKLCEGNRLCD